MIRLLYHSVSALHSSHEVDEVASIVKKSIAGNAEVGVTGALLYTGSHFAQALEGDGERIEQLLRSILADPRHSQVTVVHRDQVAERRFASWHMAYRGPATYVDRVVKELMIANCDVLSARAIPHVYELMSEFSKP